MSDARRAAIASLLAEWPGGAWVADSDPVGILGVIDGKPVRLEHIDEAWHPHATATLRWEATAYGTREHNDPFVALGTSSVHAMRTLKRKMT